MATNVRRKASPMDEAQLVAFLGKKIDRALNGEGGDISDTRQENLNYYMGAEYGNEREGYSKFVTREVMETLEWVLPSVLRIFLSGDRIVVFDPVGPEDERAAEQETDIVNHFVMKNPRSFVSLHHWVKDALMYPNGYLKLHMEERVTNETGRITGVDAMTLQALTEDPNVEILEQDSRQVIIDAPPEAEGMPPTKVPAEVFDVKVRFTKDIMQLRLDPVPPEECLVDNDLTTLDLDEADFVCHRTRKSYTKLVEEGFDRDQLDTVGQDDHHRWNDERSNRLFYTDEDPDAEGDDDDAMRMFWVHECYVYVDYDGDGLAEFRRIQMIGDQIFENEETNYQPLISIAAILMQHKHTGMSYVELVKDLQLLMSTLVRQLLDNVYKINVRRKVFSEDALTDDGATMEAMLNAQAEFIPVRGPAQNAFVPEPTHSVIADLLPVIQHANEQRSMRTGVSPEVSLDPNVLQESTYGAFMGALEQSSQRVEMLVRIFAETGFSKLMLKAHQLLRSHWDIPKTVKLRGEWVPVDPQGWRDRTDVTVNVGLGFNNKQAMLGLLTQLLAIQKEALPAGLANAEKIYHALEKLVNYSGIGDVRQFFVDPKSPEYKPPQPPPDPQMLLAQAQAQALGQEQQRKAFEAQAKVKQEEQKTQLDAGIKQQDIRAKQTDFELRIREMNLRELELMQRLKMDEEELAEKLRNMRADTVLKLSQSDKTDAETMATAVEAGETYQKAKSIVEEQNAGGEDERPEIEAETDTEED